MNLFSGIIGRDKEFSDFLRVMKSALDGGEPDPIVVNGLTGGAELLFLSEAVREAVRMSGRCALVLADSDGACGRIADALCSFGLRALVFKERDFVFYNIGASHDTERERLSVLSLVLSGQADCVVTTPGAALALTVPPRVLGEAALYATLGEEVPPEALTERLVRLGFACVDTVDGKGQFSRRGGILDLWGAETELPVRIEFFGDEVDRISAFDPITQRTVDAQREISILPAKEILVDKAARQRLLTLVGELLKKAPSENARTRLGGELSALKAGGVLNYCFLKTIFMMLPILGGVP